MLKKVEVKQLAEPGLYLPNVHHGSIICQPANINEPPPDLHPKQEEERRKKEKSRWFSFKRS